ncbi:MAG: TonB-dependent receptor [Hyphomicrobiales bacterium]|nr:TonB-dependent receptor [Hyphomicrobiales bacterium]
MKKICNMAAKAVLLATTAFPATVVMAQTAENADSTVGIAEIVVTAQKREQNLQDVPVSVAVISGEDLAANRVTSLIDVGAVAPGVSVRKTPGGLGSPQIVSRGVVSAGSLPGADKAISINIDGVYIGANYGLTNDLLDLERVEALRGPQGTLFGRNSTGGALSFVTADPTGKFGVRQQVSVGNYSQFQSVTHVELPQVGAFSGYVSYMRNERKGDIVNLQSGLVFDRSNAPGFGRQISASTLGDLKSDAVHLAVKLKPSSTFKAVYKFDWSKARTTPEGTGFIAYDPATAASFGLGGLNAAVAANPPLIAGTSRPDVVRNGFTVPGYAKSQGHNLTATMDLAESLTVKSISAYRKVSAFSSLDNLGLGQLFYPGNPDPFYVQVSQNLNKQRQWSEEVQLNYTSNLMNLTAGALYFKEKVVTGTPDGLASGGIIFGLPLPGNVLPAGKDVSHITSKSAAGYLQAEVHVTPQLDLVGGLRVTRDHKNGNYYRQAPVYAIPLTVSPFKYKSTRVTYLLGANYHFSDDILGFAKYSTGYISGGSVAGVAFAAETAKSFEAGLKSDLFDRHLRLNLTGFFAKYGNMQQQIPGSIINRSDLSLVMINFGDAEAKGFEAEATLVPIRGIVLSGAVAYTDFKFKRFTPLWRSTIIQFGGSPATFPEWLRPSTTANFAASYESEPSEMLGNGRLSIRFDTNYRSKVVTPGIFTTTIQPSMQGIYRTGGNWITNTRASLKGIDVGSGTVEIAAWARNLLNNKGTLWGGYNYFAAGTTYEPARTYGVDVIFSF